MRERALALLPPLRKRRDVGAAASAVGVLVAQLRTLAAAQRR
ncbi:MAG TPA: hypothetical protein VFD84_06175 [Candidatus Binatia bacterium]|jgi:hypothetical protein|nr:hypothetical protein [Candidatus Binatia bacterium]